METLAYRDIFLTQTQNANQHSKNSQFFPLYHSLKLGIQFNTFSCFFQVWFWFLRLSPALLWVCNRSLCIEEWISVEKVCSIFINHGLWFWFDSFEYHSKNSLKPIFLSTQMLCTISNTCQLDLRPETSIRSLNFNVLDFLWFVLI